MGRRTQSAWDTRGGPETQTALALSSGIGVYFPKAWLALHFLFNGSLGALRQGLFQETDAPELEGGGRIGLGLDLELRPSGEGFVPFGRIFGGYATLFSNGSEPDACAARRRAVGLSEERCLERPLDRVGFGGYHLGLGVGIAYQGILERLGRQAAVTLEARYEMSEWGNVFIERADGTPVETVSFLDDRGAVRIGPRLRSVYPASIPGRSESMQMSSQVHTVVSDVRQGRARGPWARRRNHDDGQTYIWTRRAGSGDGRLRRRMR